MPVLQDSPVFHSALLSDTLSPELLHDASYQLLEGEQQERRLMEAIERHQTEKVALLMGRFTRKQDALKFNLATMDWKVMWFNRNGHKS